ncbi:hypothetical protein HanIR_Chr16g0813401 [Helianthus annuus]|nr:hypothetical protein HanIR_Chr16g0813401 [Helianthus annuus]
MRGFDGLPEKTPSSPPLITPARPAATADGDVVASPPRISISLIGSFSVSHPGTVAATIKRCHQPWWPAEHHRVRERGTSEWGGGGWGR